MEMVYLPHMVVEDDLGWEGVRCSIASAGAARQHAFRLDIKKLSLVEAAWEAVF